MVVILSYPLNNMWMLVSLGLTFDSVACYTSIVRRYRAANYSTSLHFPDIEVNVAVHFLPPLEQQNVI